MCGICGFIGASNKDNIFKMTDKLIHRGPDEFGHFYSPENNIALGHRRLKIIDLNSGQQPMFNSDKSLAIVFNGEIYNFLSLKKKLESNGYKFASNSDTEVLLYAYQEWREDCLNYLNGMFAFVIVNLQNNTVFAARDRFGKKPFYYFHSQKLFAFASELTALLQLPEIEKKINYSALKQYLFFEYVPAPLSIIENIYKLPAGYYLKFENNKLTIEKYWDVSLKSIKISEADAEIELIRLLKKSLEYRLISDVPLGIFLSGGIDSSSIVALLSELRAAKTIKTFSIGFSEKTFDESSFAKQVATFFGTDHYEEKLEPQIMIDIIPEIFNRLDEPLADPSIIPTYLLSKFTRRYVTVALGGDGGDELFAGYDPFAAHQIIRNFRLPAIIADTFLNLAHLLLPVSDVNMSFDFKIKRSLSGIKYPPLLRNEVWLSSFDLEKQQQLLQSHIATNITIDIYAPINNLEFSNRETINLPIISKMIYSYIKLYLQNDILTKVDRASMLNSLEVRAPFLDVEVAEFVNSLPEKYKIKNLTRKYLLKKALKNKLPMNIINRNKKGFGVPLSAWFKTKLKDMLFDILNKNQIAKDGLFNYNYVEKMINEHLSNKRDYRKELWTLLAFQLWKNKIYEN